LSNPAPQSPCFRSELSSGRFSSGFAAGGPTTSHARARPSSARGGPARRSCLAPGLAVGVPGALAAGPHAHLAVAAADGLTPRSGGLYAAEDPEVALGLEGEPSDDGGGCLGGEDAEALEALAALACLRG
jgi:hypothetical protein